jgi:uncharacterized repeat protein (TIGR01451 family)
VEKALHPNQEDNMFWRKALQILVISILLMGGIAVPSVAEEGKISSQTSLAKSTIDSDGERRGIDKIGNVTTSITNLAVQNGYTDDGNGDSIFNNNTLSMSVDNPAPAPGEIITFTIKVTNNMTETITGGVISDTLPAGLNFLEIITLDPPLSGTLSYELPILVTDLEIAPSKQVTLTFPASLSDGLAGGTVITNTASLTSNEVTTPITVSTTLIVQNRIFLPCVFNGFCTDFFDDFSNPASGWSVDDDEYRRVEYRDGEYRVLTKQSGYLYLFTAPTCPRENYVVESEVRWNESDYGFGYGLIFGVKEDFVEYYYFDVLANDQSYRLWRRDSTGFTLLAGPTGSSDINPGTNSNHLKVTREGDQISLNVNGVDLGTWTDGNITGLTYAGVAATPYGDKPVSDARFDNFSLHTLPGSSTLSLQTTNAVRPTFENDTSREKLKDLDW